MAVIFQCTACRALGAAADVVVALDGTRAGLVCSLCRFTSWLPVSGHADAATSPSPSASTSALPAPLLSLPPPSVLPVAPAPSTSAPAPAPSTSATSAPSALVRPVESAVAVTGGLAEAERVRARLETLPPPNETQRTLAAQFEKLLEVGWANTAAHKTLLKAASLQGELAFVGNRYRAVLDVVRDEPQAKAAQQELLTLAMLTMQTSKDLGSVERQGTTRGQIVLAIVVVVGLLVAGGFMVRMILRTFDTMSKIEQ